MTDKRFRLGIDNKNGVGLFDGEIRLLYIRFNNIEDAVSCEDALNHHCNLMNELHEENTMLKERRHEDINDLSVIAMKYKALEKENERLRKCINEIYTIARLEEVD